MTDSKPSTRIEADVVVVGAGMAGLYATWRLLQRNPGLNIHVVEALPRTGGRLESDHVQIRHTSVKVEEGGMRFMKDQVELIQLIAELDLSSEVVDFPMGDDHNLYYLRGRRFSLGDAKDDPTIWSDLYALNRDAEGQQPGEVLKGLLTAILEENDVPDPQSWNPTPDDWTRLRLEYTYKGIPTFKWGFWAMLVDYGLTPDCVEMLYQSSGFIAPYDQPVNAGCALQLLVDFVNPTFHTLSKGYEALPDALTRAIGKQGATLHLGHPVVAMDRQQDGRLRVDARTQEGTPLTFSAGHVVLGLTQVALENLIPYVPFFRDSRRFLAAVGSVTDMQLGKINLYYDHNWWTPASGVWSGGSYTDLPMAQFYCFAPNPDVDPELPAAITLYTDYYRTVFWAQLQALGEPYRAANGPPLPPNAEAASTYVVASAHAQMKELFGLPDIPAPILATYRRWGVPPAGDGDHQWAVGANDKEVRRYLTNPFPNVHVCGETWSDDQAWVNGALRSVDQMLASSDIGA